MIFVIVEIVGKDFLIMMFYGNIFNNSTKSNREVMYVKFYIILLLVKSGNVRSLMVFYYLICLRSLVVKWSILNLKVLIWRKEK